jgi:hypothetical protein
MKNPVREARGFKAAANRPGAATAKRHLLAKRGHPRHVRSSSISIGHIPALLTSHDGKQNN